MYQQIIANIIQLVDEAQSLQDSIALFSPNKTVQQLEVVNEKLGKIHSAIKEINDFMAGPQSKFFSQF